MLIPDLNKTTECLKLSASTASTVTNYAQATLTAIPKLQNPPSWFAPIQNNLTTAQGHAHNWLKNICPAVTANLPRSIINFSQTFQSTSEEILGIQQAIESAGGQPSPQQRAAVGALFDDLAVALGDQEKAVASIQTDIKGHSSDVKTDQDRLASDLGAVSERFVNGSVWIQEMTAAIGDDFLDCSVLGPCIAIAEINLNISLKVGGIGSDPSLFTLVFAKAILKNQIDNSQAAQRAIQGVLDNWTTLKVKNEAVISDLKDAQDSQYINILSQIDLKTAQAQWRQLADFASGLTNQVLQARGL